MDEKNHFALVPRPPGALEKAEPGAKRILSGMVADTLALVEKTAVTKPLFCVLLGGLLESEPIKRIIISALNARYNLRFIHFTKFTQLIFNSEVGYDLIVLNVLDIEWKIDDVNCLRWLEDAKRKWDMTDGPVRTAAKVLGWLKAKYCKPILASPGARVATELETVGVTVLKAPFTAKKLLDALQLPQQQSPSKQLFSVTIWEHHRYTDYQQRILSVPLQEILGDTYSLVFNCWDYHHNDNLLRACGGFDLLLIFLPPKPPVAVKGKRDPHELITYLKSKYQKPIIILSEETFWKMIPSAEWQNAGADAYLSVDPPFPAEAFKQSLKTCVAKSLATRNQAEKPVESPDQPRKTRPLRIVVVDDDDLWLELMVDVVRKWFNDTETVTFNSSLAALRELEQRDPDLLITGDKMPRMTGEELVRRLIAKNVNYPILVLTGNDQAQQWVREFASRGFNVRFQPKRGVEHELKRSIEEILNPQRGPIEKSVEITTQPHKTRPPRIVVVDDDDDWLNLMEANIQDWIKDATVLLFQNGHAAWQELLRADPDLLITDIGRPTFTAEDMLPLLAKRNVKYPILIVSGHHDKKVHRQLRESAGLHLNLTFLTKPVVPEEFEKCIHTLLAAFMATDNEK